MNPFAALLSALIIPTWSEPPSDEAERVYEDRNQTLAIGTYASLPTFTADARPGPQPAREPTARLAVWESLKYGMFIHFGLSTFINNECPGPGTDPAAYNPTNLDVDQWVRVAKDAGMKYAVLTAKHCAGHCLWPSTLTEHDVESSPVKTDVVGQFVASCRRHGLRPGLYYLLGWDSAHQPKMSPAEYEAFCTGQLEELLTSYGPIEELFLDIPWDMGPDTKGALERIYARIKSLQPDCLVLPNQGFVDGSAVSVEPATWRHERAGGPVALWPRDLMDGERTLPPPTGHNPRVALDGTAYYLPMEVCDTLGENWFAVEGDRPRPLRRLYQLYRSCTDRGANLLLDVAPDTSGRIPEPSIRRLMELKALIDAGAPLPVSALAGRPAKASNIYRGDQTWAPAMAIDGDYGTRWATDDDQHAAWLEIDLVGDTTFDSAFVCEGWDRVRAFEIQVPDGNGGWRTVHRGTTIGTDGTSMSFPAVTARAVRLNITQATVGPTIHEFEVFRAGK